MALQGSYSGLVLLLVWFIPEVSDISEPLFTNWQLKIPS